MAAALAEIQAAVAAADRNMSQPPEPPPPEPDLDLIIGIEQYTADIASGERSWVVWDHCIWRRNRREGGFDGYRTWPTPSRRLPCDTMEKAVRRPDMADEIRRLSYA
jgi:hypothetical protein